MDVETRELHRSDTGDVWRLVFHRARGTMHVRHEWMQDGPFAPGQPRHLTRDIAFGSFFESGPEAVVAEVKRLLAPIFPDPRPGG